MFSFFSANKLSSTESVDIIEKIVYDYIKPLGFKKYGRTLHRFVDGDISQVINFQNGCPQRGVYNTLWVNVGIRVPECVERKFENIKPIKKYYHEYECNIRARLGCLVDGKDTFYNLQKDPYKIGQHIVKRLKKYVIPVFEALNSRDAILNHRTEYPSFDQFNRYLISLEEAMIMGRHGNISEATRLFNAHYKKALADYNHQLTHGTQTYLKKGQSLYHYDSKAGEVEKFIAEEDGYITTYFASRVHLDYLENLALELDIVIS